VKATFDIGARSTPPEELTSAGGSIDVADSELFERQEFLLGVMASLNEAALLDATCPKQHLRSFSLVFLVPRQQPCLALK